MFYHFIIHSQFEHDLSHTRANGSPSEEPDSALSDDPTVHRNGPVWSGHDSGSRACSGGVEVARTDSGGEYDEHRPSFHGYF